MNEFLDQDIISLAQYDKYCYYVAGLVGINAIELSILSKVCAPFSIPDETKRSLCISAGLLLQKVNIIRDIREDLLQIPQPRIFWPKEVRIRGMGPFINYVSRQVGVLRLACYCANFDTCKTRPNFCFT